MEKIKVKSNKKVLVLRTCNEDMTSTNGFKWPKKGPVKCTDWKPTNECGNGLHGFLFGEGEGELASWADTAKWLVVSVSEADIVNLYGKVKFPKGNVVFCGNRFDATQYIAARAPNSVKAIIGHTSVSGDKGVSTSGERGTSTSGYMGTSVSGRFGTSTSGDWGTSTSGHYGTSTSGFSGTSTSGDSGTSTSDDLGTSTSGFKGTSTSGDEGTSTSGVGGELRIRWYDGQRYRLAIGYVGEGGILPNIAYCLDDKGNFVKKV